MNEAAYDPDAGTIGYLTYDQWDRFARAWQTAYKHLPWWWVAGHVRGGDVEELRPRGSENPLPLPATWLAAHEVTRLMNELNAWPELEDAAKTQDGAELILLLTREVETAAARWPYSDRTHRIGYFRCPACQQLTLKYYPPNPAQREDAPAVDVQIRGRDGKLHPVELLDVVVRCTDRSCNAVMGSTRFEIAVKLIEWEHEQEKANAKRRLDQTVRRPRSGEQIQGDDLALGKGGEGTDHAPEQGAVVVPAGPSEIGE